MASTNRDYGHLGRRGLRSNYPNTRSSPSGSPDDVLAQHQIDNERNPEESSSGGGGGSDTSEDIQDGTTQYTPPSMPRDPTRTPPASTSPAEGQIKYSRLTSGHTQCRPRATGSDPQKYTASHEKRRHEPLDEASPPPSRTYDSQQHRGLTSPLLILICLLVLAGLWALILALHGTPQEQKAPKKAKKPISEVHRDLMSELQSLNQEFSQPREVWLGLVGQLATVMVDEPQQPAVLLLVVPDDSRGTATCLAHRLAQAVQYAFEDIRFVMFDTRSSEYQDSSLLLKVELDDTLRALAEAHAVVVHNIESIPGPAAMILHAYCDNENAPHKQAIIFLLVEIPGTYEELGHSRLDLVVDAHLARVWGAGAGGGLPEKDVSALISRTANAPVLIRPEKGARMQKLCPV